MPPEHVRRVGRTVQRFWALGGAVVSHQHHREVRHGTAPDQPLGNFTCGVRGGPAATAELLRTAATASHPSSRRVLVDRATPAAVEASLVLDGWRLERQLELVLPADVPVASPAEPNVLPVQSDEDWAAVAELFRVDHLEEDAKAGRDPRPTAVTASAVALRRAQAPAVERFLAIDHERVVGCIAVWPGDEGVGLVEDVFVLPDARGAAVATAMLQHAVHRARLLGAEEIVIGADPEDTPKRLYARFGFEPAVVRHSYVRPVPDQAGADAERPQAPLVRA